MVLMFQSYMIIRLMVLMLIWTIDDNIWLVVKTILKNMKVSCDDHSHVLWKITNVPNHQSYIYIHTLYIYIHPPTWPFEILVEKMMNRTMGFWGTHRQPGSRGICLSTCTYHAVNYHHALVVLPWKWSTNGGFPYDIYIYVYIIRILY